MGIFGIGRLIGDCRAPKPMICGKHTFKNEKQGLPYYGVEWMGEW
ncbi:hypothetical protein MPER_03369 [Moniliophthora perniciosa FA553]|nr:hypothetical protein MPER_03369 [Moniliophthora perniciosa FA553]